MTSSPFADPTEAAAELAYAMQAIGQASVHGPFEVEVRIRVIPARVAQQKRQMHEAALQQLRERTEPPLQSEPRGRGLSR